LTGTHRGGRGGVRGRKHLKDERTTRWGSSLLTFSTKRDGTRSVQATCHRKHAHPPLPGKPSTLCRTTYTESVNHTVADCERLCKMWITRAGDYRNRLRHQAKRFSVDEVDNDEELEARKPLVDYNSGDEEGLAAPAPIRPRMRIIRKCAFPVEVIE
jgi:hypothetical protein